MNNSDGDTTVRKDVRLSHGLISFMQAGEGVPVIFLHGINGNASSWSAQLEALTSGMKMWAWDAPGYGDSDVAGDTLDDLARAGIEFIQSVAAQPVNLVGHSMGGLVAMRIVLQQPQLVDRLVLSCTHPGHAAVPGGTGEKRYLRRLAEMRELPAREYGARRAKGMLPEGTDERVVATVARIAAQSRLEGVANAAHAIQMADLKPDLERIQAPTLVITCDRDTVAPLKKAEPLIQKIPGARHVELQGLGHAPYLEDPDRYNTVLSDFLLPGRVD